MIFYNNTVSVGKLLGLSVGKLGLSVGKLGLRRI